MNTYGRTAPLKLVSLRRFVNDGPGHFGESADPLRRLMRKSCDKPSDLVRRLALYEQLRKGTRWESASAQFEI